METVIVLKPIRNSGGIVDRYEEYEVDKELAMEQLGKPNDQRNAHWRNAKLKSDVQLELTPEEKIKFDLYMQSKNPQPPAPLNSLEILQKEYKELTGKSPGKKTIETLVKEIGEFKSKTE